MIAARVFVFNRLGLMYPQDVRLILTTVIIAILPTTIARADSGGRTLRSADGKYQLAVPQGWDSHDFHIDAVQIGAMNKDRGEYGELIGENIEEYTDSLAQYADAKRDTMAMSLDNPTLTAGQQMKINGLDAIRFELHGQLPNSNTKIGYVVTVLKTKLHYIQVIGWTLDSHFDEHHDELAGLANGFSENSAAGK
jgi:hypothetical protein